MIENLRFDKILLVLGNGFDLNCGCHSAYVDYFKHLEKIAPYATLFLSYIELSQTKIESKDELAKDIVNYLISHPEISILTFYFYTIFKSGEPKTGNWLDIEAELKDFLLNELVTIEEVIDNDDSEYSEYNSASVIIMISRVLKKRINNFESQKENGISIREMVCDYLFEDLKRLEKDFAKYLAQYNTREFIDKRSELLSKLKNIFPSNTEFKICSFNYTTIETNDEIINLHGTMSNPIIGIDMLPEDDPRLRRFVKSDRKISDEDIPSLSSILREDKYALVFYGCSLCPTDKDELAAFRYFTRPDFQFYILYNEYTKDGALYNPRQSLVDNLQEYLLGSNGRDYGINNMASFDYSYQSGTINFINIDKI